MVELLTKPHCRARVLGSQAALTEISPVRLEADAEIDMSTEGTCVGSCLLGQSIPIGKRRQDSEGKVELQGGSKGLSINSWRELSGLDGPSELDHHLLPPPPTPATGGPDLYSLMPMEGSRLFQWSNQGSWEAGKDKFTQS